MHTATAKYPQEKINQYLINQVSASTPEQLILKVYDFAISSCLKHDMLKTNDALQVLINSLNFEDARAKEISVGLLNLYIFCQNQMRKKNFQAVQKILSELRETWQAALRKGQ
ncbi:MAG: flagellar export chaperone FliS [Bacteroidota bacterium]